jgi:hypothetical protein
MANTVSIKDEDLKSILAEVEDELQKYAKSELGLVLSKGFEESSEGSASPAAEESSEGSSEDGLPGSEVSASGEDGSGAMEGPPAVSSADAPPAEGSEAPVAEAAPGSAPAPGGELPPGEEGVVDAAHDHQALTAAMSSLSPEDVMAVYLAAKQCLLDGHGEAAAAGPDQAAPPPGAGSPAPADAPPPGGSPLAMSEKGLCKKCGGSMEKDELHASNDKKDALVGSKEGEVFTSPDKKDAKGGGADMGAKGTPKSGPSGDGASMAGTGKVDGSSSGAKRPEESDKGSGEALKSEAKAGEDLQKAENEDLKAQVELLAKALELTLGAPIRKAITKTSDLAFVPKSGDGKEVDVSSLSKDEITAKLNEKACDPKLSKADRGLIMDYYERNVNFDAVAHLVK